MTADKTETTPEQRQYWKDTQQQCQARKKGTPLEKKLVVPKELRDYWKIKKRESRAKKKAEQATKEVKEEPQ